MWKYNNNLSFFINWKLIVVFFVGLFFNFSFLQAAYLTSSDLKKLKYSCYIEATKPIFCSFEDIQKPDIVILLPLLKPVKLNNGVRAYRLMATITNKMTKTITGAKVRLKFKDVESVFLDFLVIDQIKYNMSSTTHKSHLIREDVPKITQLYQKLNNVYYTADISKLDFEVKELRFEQSQ